MPVPDRGGPQVLHSRAFGSKGCGLIWIPLPKVAEDMSTRGLVRTAHGGRPCDYDENLADNTKRSGAKGN
jgi:hypothetical protein